MPSTQKPQVQILARSLNILSTFRCLPENVEDGMVTLSTTRLGGGVRFTCTGLVLVLLLLARSISFTYRIYIKMWFDVYHMAGFFCGRQIARKWSFTEKTFTNCGTQFTIPTEHDSNMSDYY